MFKNFPSDKIYPDFDLIKHKDFFRDEHVSQYEILTKVRKFDPKTEKYYLWQVRIVEYSEVAALKLFLREVYKIIVFGEVMPDVVNMEGEPVFPEDTNQEHEVYRMYKQYGKP